MDKRNTGITVKIFDILNNIKGFDVAYTNPQVGKILVRYKGVTYCLAMSPVYNDTPEGKAADSQPFETVVKANGWLFK